MMQSLFPPEVGIKRGSTTLVMVTGALNGRNNKMLDKNMDWIDGVKWNGGEDLANDETLVVYTWVDAKGQLHTYKLEKPARLSTMHDDDIAEEYNGIVTFKKWTSRKKKERKLRLVVNGA